MKLTTGELVYINEAAKALKQKDIILIDNVMIGLDNIQNMLTYVFLDTNFITNYHNGIIINQRSLSAFIKNLSVESEFEFDSTGGIIRTINGTELPILCDNYIARLACDKFKYGEYLNTLRVVIKDNEIQDIATRIQNMKSGDGSICINYNGYYMTLFPSILPMNKSDKMFVTIIQPELLHTFIAKFCIRKKKFDIITYINYLKV